MRILPHQHCPRCGTPIRSDWDGNAFDLDTGARHSCDAYAGDMYECDCGAIIQRLPNGRPVEWPSGHNHQCRRVRSEWAA